MRIRLLTTLFATCLVVAGPGSAEEPETVLLNDKILVCDAEGCLEVVADGVETPALKPEREAVADRPVVDTAIDEPTTPQNTIDNEPGDNEPVENRPDDSGPALNEPGVQWLLALGVLGVLLFAGLGFQAMARKRDDEAADDIAATGRAPNGAQEGTQLSIRNINILDDRFSKFEIDIVNQDQDSATAIALDAKIIIRRLNGDNGAGAVAEKGASALIAEIPGGGAEKVTLGIFLYRGMFDDRDRDETDYDVEVAGAMRWTDASGKSREREFSFSAPAITGKNFAGKADQTGFAMAPGAIGAAEDS